MCVCVFCCKASSLLKPTACTRPGEKVTEMKTSFVGVTGLIHKSQGRIFCSFISPFCAIALASQTPHVHLLVALVGSSVQRTHKERPGQSWASIQKPIRMKPSKKNIGKSGATSASLEVSRSWIRKNHDIVIAAVLSSLQRGTSVSRRDVLSFVRYGLERSWFICHCNSGTSSANLCCNSPCEDSRGPNWSFPHSSKTVCSSGTCKDLAVYKWF